jgi:hypothetical protein
LRKVGNNHKKIQRGLATLGRNPTDSNGILAKIKRPRGFTFWRKNLGQRRVSVPSTA